MGSVADGGSQTESLANVRSSASDQESTDLVQTLDPLGDVFLVVRFSCSSALSGHPRSSGATGTYEYDQVKCPWSIDSPRGPFGVSVANERNWRVFWEWVQS